MGRCLVLTLFLLLVNGVFADDVVTVSVIEGDSVTLKTDITKKQHDKMLWYFGDTRVALINGHLNTSCLYDGEGGMFRDRLKVDFETGSLTITNVRPEHAGRYEAELIRSKSSGKRQSLNRNRKCDSTKITQKISIANDDATKTFNLIIMASLSDEDEVNEHMEKQKFDSRQTLAAVAGICVAVVLLVVSAAVGVIYYRRRRSKNDKEEKQERSTEERGS